MSALRPVLATVGNVIDLAVTCFLVFKGFVWGGIGGASLYVIATGDKELSLLIAIFALIGALIGAFIGLVLSGIVSAALAPLYWTPPPPTHVLPAEPPMLPRRSPGRRSTNNPLQPHRYED